MTAPGNHKSINCLKDPWLWVLLFISAAYRLLFFMAGRAPWAYPDTYSYYELAKFIVAQGNFGPRVWLTPAYPLFLAISEWFPWGSYRWVAAALQQSLGLLSLGLLYAIGLRFFKSLPRPRLLAFLAGLLYLNARYPLYDHSILADSLFTSLVVMQSYLLVRYLESKGLGWLFFLGLLLGISTLVKPIDQLAWFVVALSLLLWQRPFLKTLRGVGLMVLACLMVVSLWVGRNYLYHGYLGISAYGGYQRLIRTVKYFNKYEFIQNYRKEKSLQEIKLPPNETTPAKLREIVRGLSEDPQVQDREYRRLLRLLMGARLVEHLGQTKGYRSRSVFYTFRDFYGAGFDELVVVSELGKLSGQIMANPKQPTWSLYFKDSFTHHLPEMMLWGKKSNIATSNAKKLNRFAKQKEGKGEGGVALSLLNSLTHYLYWPNLFRVLSPLALLGFLGALIFKFNTTFSFYALIRTAYFPGIVILFGNGFERYRLPVDHLIILGAILAIAVASMGIERLWMQVKGRNMG